MLDATTLMKLTQISAKTLDSLCSLAYKNGFLPNDSFPYIPELGMEARDTCASMLKGFIHMYKTGDLTEHPFDEPMIYLYWCFYVGIGAVVHWKMDSDQLKEKGIFATLTEPKGINAMDDYVVELLGGDMPKTKNMLRDNVEVYSEQMEVFFYNEMLHNNCIEILKSDESTSILYVMEGMIMFKFGMIYQMQKLGIS